MKILVVHPGASYAIADVHDGLLPALEAEGVEVVRYALDHRIESAASWLLHNWRRAGKPKDNRPGPLDYMYLAGSQVIERALYLDVDYVLVVSGIYFIAQWMRIMKKAGLKIGCLFTESPYEDDQQVEWAKNSVICWTNERTSVSALQEHCPRVHYLRHAYNPKVHHVGIPKENVCSHDVLFIGTGFPERVKIFKEVNWDGINLGMYGEWGFVGSRSKLRKYIKGIPILNSEAVEMYRRAKIVPNIYRTSKRYHTTSEHIYTSESLNPRAYELAACGVFSISDWRPEVGELFGDLIPTFKNSEEFEDLIHKYLSDEGARKRVEAQLPEVVQGHTFKERARQILSDLEGV